MKSSIVCLDIFAGAGGLGEGLMTAGIEIPVAVELHPHPASTYSLNHPTTSLLVGDIRDLDPKLIEDLIISKTGSPKIDLIVGGPPCQGFSTAGKKDELDPRNNLFLQFIRMVEYFKPRAFMLENVPGFKRMYQGKIYEQALKSFSSLGYEFEDKILDAMDFGVPQRRKRFIMIGWRKEEKSTFEWPTPKFGTSSLFDIDIVSFVTVEDALEDISFLLPGFEAHRNIGESQSSFQKARRSNDILFNHLATRHRDRAVKIFEYIPEGGNISSVPANIKSGKRTMARLDRKSTSNAVLAMPDDLIHYKHNRIPTVREMARLQTFDDNYVFLGKRTSGFMERRIDVPQYTQVGNAVPPLLGQALGESLIKFLDGDKKDIRDLDKRIRRHSGVRGSSGYSGYTLSPIIADELNIFNLTGNKIILPTSITDKPVIKNIEIINW